MKLVHLVLLSCTLALPSAAEEAPTTSSINEEQQSEFVPEETTNAGFLTSAINNSLEKAFANTPAPDGKPQLGRTLTDYVGAPKIGGYFVGKYTYSDQPGKRGGDGFSQRYLRLHLDGTILNDFKYRVQLQMNNSTPHLKDIYMEWVRWDAFSVKVGQFKRAFTFENPYSPWNLGSGDYSQMVKKLAGMGDYCGESSVVGGRDQGIQIQGDLFPSKKDGHHFVHYQLQMMNGQGINSSDENGGKDFLGTLQVQPVKDLFIGVFGWKGSYTGNGQTVDRHRWAASVKYEHNDWSFRAEYAHSKGYRITDYDKATDTWSGTGKADGWYATVGVPCTPWLKIYGKYDAYRYQKTWDSMKTIYSIIPNIQIHKNLLLQVQYNYVHDRDLQRKDYNEVWTELFVRF